MLLCFIDYAIIDLYIFITVYIDPPVLKLDVRQCNPVLGSLYNTSMLPLQDDTVLVCHEKDNKHHVSRLSDRGDVIRNLITHDTGIFAQLFSDKNITGIILMSEDECLVLHQYGRLQRVRIEDGQVLGSGYKVPKVEYLNDGIRIDDDQVLLVDKDKGEVITYNLKTRNKHVVIDKLRVPTSVDKAVTDQGVFYIVSEQLAHTIRVYNDRWRLVTSIGGRGGDDGRLNNPQTARVLPDNTIIVIDYSNHRISRFTIQGDFIDHVIKQSDGIRYPTRLAVQYPYVWVSGGGYHYNIKCYQINT